MFGRLKDRIATLENFRECERDWRHNCLEDRLRRIERKIDLIAREVGIEFYDVPARMEVRVDFKKYVKSIVNDVKEVLKEDEVQNKS